MTKIAFVVWDPTHALLGFKIVIPTTTIQNQTTPSKFRLIADRVIGLN
jgi:hypothetical protein